MTAILADENPPAVPSAKTTFIFLFLFCFGIIPLVSYSIRADKVTAISAGQNLPVVLSAKTAFIYYLYFFFHTKCDRVWPADSESTIQRRSHSESSVAEGNGENQ